MALDEWTELIDLLQVAFSQAPKAQAIGESIILGLATQLKTALQYHLISFGREPKNWGRILEKASRIRTDEGIETTAVADRVSSDFAGGRVVVAFQKDIGPVYQEFRAALEARDDARFSNASSAYQDYRQTPKNGYRALHQLIEVRLDNARWFPFEVQFLTLLQLDWAVQAHAVYEQPDRFPTNIHDALRQISDELHEIGARCDELSHNIEATAR